MHKAIPLDALYEAVIVTDADFAVVECNARAVELFREPSVEAFIGRSPHAHMVDSELHLDATLHERLRTEAFIPFECTMRRSDGTTFFAEAAVHRLSERAYIFSVRDISRRKEAFLHLEAANERLRAQDRSRVEFVSNVSHELRTPLTSMSYALTNMLRGLCGPLPEKAVAYLERLQVDTRRLMTTVNDILDMRQLEQGTLKLNKVPLPIHRLLSEVSDALAIQIEAKHQTLSLRLAPQECYILADRYKFERIFFNLLANAIKYTPDGGTITLSTHRDDDGQLVIWVDDNGIGIPKEALPKVTRRFFRVGDQIAGTGLGLSIVRELVELHGGTFAITSPVPDTEQGTRVTLTMPTVPGPLCVLLTGDETFVEELRPLIETCGNTLYVDRDGIDLEKELAAVNPALFLLDGTLPESLLNEMICQLRSAPRFAQLPIVILTTELITDERRAEYARMRVTIHRRPLTPVLFRTLR